MDEMTRIAPDQPVVEAHGTRIPKLGFGTFGVTGEEARTAVATALEVGYRHVDTAEMYGNEREVGEGIRDSGVPRDAIFLTTKVWHENLADGVLQRSAERSVETLGVGPVDLYLIHWPSRQVPVEEAVRALNAVKAAGLAKAIGVSNFPVALLERAWAASEAPLVANQVEYHPNLDQSPVLGFLRAHGMALTAYCPIARGRLFHNETVAAIAARHGATPSQVLLAWLIAQDVVAAIPKSGRRERIEENFGALSVRLSDEEMAALHALARPDGRIIDPAFGPDWDA